MTPILHYTPAGSVTPEWLRAMIAMETEPDAPTPPTTEEPAL